MKIEACSTNKPTEPQPNQNGTLLDMRQDPSEITENPTPKSKRKLSTIFGVKIFQKYLYGRKFTVINFHQSLKSTFSKLIVTKL